MQKNKNVSIFILFQKNVFIRAETRIVYVWFILWESEAPVISMECTSPMLVNYAVSIPPGGRTDAFVHTVITWSYEGREFRTRGLDADQTEAAIKATIKMLNIIEES